MASLTPQEQLMIELINRARMNPVAEAAEFGIAISAAQKTQKQVLAGNDKLSQASHNHSNWMLVNDQFSHEEPNTFPSRRTGTNPDDRIEARGYDWSLVGENISWTGSTGVVNLTTAIIAQHESLFRSSGHRANILNAGFDEVGIGQISGKFLDEGTNWNASMVTQVFATPAPNRVFVTGVVYNDTKKNDNFFTVGEQRANFSITSTSPLEKTGAGGGYEIAFAPGAGAQTISFGAVRVSVTISSLNVKVDFVNGREIWTDSNLTAVSTNITELHALGKRAVVLKGSAGNEKIFGNDGANNLQGNGGNDILNGGLGNDRLAGGAGNDMFVFNTKLSTSTNRDTISDFSAADDTIRLDNAIFTKLGAVGALNAAFFKVGARALDANDYIVYNRNTGVLSYDADGNRPGAAVQFATLTTKPIITVDDFKVI